MKGPANQIPLILAAVFCLAAIQPLLATAQDEKNRPTWEELVHPSHRAGSGKAAFRKRSFSQKKRSVKRKKSSARTAPGVSSSLNSLVQDLLRSGKVRSSESVLQRALAIDQKAFGVGHPAVALSLYHLASVYNAEGRYADAEPLYRRILAIDENAFGT